MSETLEKEALVPKLRFPEFQAEWLDTRIGEICPFQRGFDLPSYEIEAGSVPVFYSNGVGGTHARGMAFGPGIVTGRSGTIGKTHYIASGPYWPHNTTLWVTAFHKCDPLFAFYLLRSFQIERYGTGSGVPTLNRNSLHEHRIAVPLTLDEQRKIAKCLESLDELIGAETEKLEVLKRHKKGLLQQLFPAEGETSPRLRFPQFRNAGEWSYSLLEEVAENLDNHRIPISSSQRVRGSTPYYGASGIVDFVEGYIFDETLLCVSEDGANLVARSTPIAFTIEGQTWVNNHAHVLKFANRHIHSLVEAYLNQMDLGDFLTGMAQPKLNRGMLDTIAIPLPSLQEEAASVAEVIITADSGLSESARRLQALHKHKDALMQQLFPSMEEEHPNA